jgi:hypothetical protein
MDRIRNPFSPGAGAPPPELAGRSALLEQATVLFARVLAKRPERSMLLTGLRGVGKTVLLNEMERMAIKAGVRTILIEAHEDKPLPALIVPHLRRLLFDLDRIAGVGQKTRRALGVLSSFLLSLKLTAKVSGNDLEFGLGLEPERGTADSGDLEVDLSDLFIAVGEAAQERKTAIALFIDEVQYFSTAEFSALIMAMHRMQQRQLPIVLVGAGLPILPRLAGESKSYAERLFSFPQVGPLEDADAREAIAEPIADVGESIADEALGAIVKLTQGYPYFLQEWGYQVWNHAPSSPITAEHVGAATPEVIRRLDENFFRVRFDRLTPKEKEYLRAMAGLGSGPYRTGDIADALGVRINKLGPVRASLIKKGMIYSPAHGDMAFTVPLFDEYMRRAIPEP